MDNPDELLTTEEVGKILKKSSQTVRSYIQREMLAAVFLDGSYLVYRRDLDEFLAQRYKRPEKKE